MTNRSLPEKNNRMRPQEARCDHDCLVLGTQQTTNEMRCDCGSLLARRMERSIELKCRRCKRRVIVSTL